MILYAPCPTDWVMELWHGEPTRVLFDKEGEADKDLFGIYDALYKQYIKSDVQPVYEPPYVNTDTIQKPIIGADISWLPNQEQRGIVFSHNGVQKDALKILKENGFNWIRLRLLWTLRQKRDIPKMVFVGWNPLYPWPSV